MFTNQNVPDHGEIDALAGQADGMISSYRNMLSLPPRKDPYAQEQLRCQIESLCQQLCDLLDKLSDALVGVEAKLAQVEHDYEAICSDKALLHSEAAREKYDNSVEQLENLHRRYISMQQLLQNNIDKIQGAISGGGPTYATGTSHSARLRRPQSEDLAPDSLDHLYDIDAVRSQQGPDFHEQQRRQIESVTVATQPDDPMDNPVREQMVSQNADPFVQKQTNIHLAHNNDDSKTSNVTRRDQLAEQRREFSRAAERIEEIVLNHVFRDQDYHLGGVEALIQGTQALSSELADYCKKLTPITAENWTDSVAEDWYAVKEHYQDCLHGHLGGLYEYLAAAESEMRWVDYNMSPNDENSPFDNDERDIESPKPELELLQKEHLGAIAQIKAEIDSLESLLARLDRKSWPYRQPKKSRPLGKNNPIGNETSDPKDNPRSDEQTFISTDLPSAAIPSEGSQKDGPDEQPIISPPQRSRSGHTEDSALYFYNYKSWREGGTRDLLNVTDQAITTLLRLNDILPTVDRSGHSECYYAENQYAKKEKHKLDVLQTLGYLNIHLAEVNSEINRLQFWLENPIKDNDPRHNWQTKQQELTDRLAVDRRCRDDIVTMIARVQHSITLADNKLWPGSKPREQFDMPKGSSSATPEVEPLAKDKYS